MTSERERTWEGRLWTALQAIAVIVVGFGLNQISSAMNSMTAKVETLAQTVARIDERVAYAIASQKEQLSQQVQRDNSQDARFDNLRLEMYEIYGVRQKSK